jgi:small-conductance mechanosensitive channel
VPSSSFSSPIWYGTQRRRRSIASSPRTPTSVRRTPTRRDGEPGCARCCRFSGNILFVVVIAVAALMVLAAMGVEIGPLVAGLSVLGVAIGFGAQNFIRDIIAGMFLSALLALRDWRRAWTEAVWRGVCLSPWMVI